MEKKVRNFQYDLMRVIAMLMVLSLHVEAQTRFFKRPYNAPWYISTIIIGVLIVANPLFFMLSGKFNLKKISIHKKNMQFIIIRNLYQF